MRLRHVALTAGIVMVLGLDAFAGSVDDAWQAHKQGDYVRAWALALDPAIHGQAQAQFLVATMFAEGQGVEENDCIATLWYDKAARSGNAHAQSYLAYSYAHGIGVRKDLERAYTWALSARKGGGVQGDEGVERVREMLTKDRRDQVEAAADRWDPRGQAPADIYILPDEWLRTPGAPYRHLGLSTCKDSVGPSFADEGKASRYPDAIMMKEGMDARTSGNFALAWDRLLPNAVAGFPLAQALVAALYGDRESPIYDRCLAVLWADKAARAGEDALVGQGMAQYVLSLGYQGGYGVVWDPGKDLRWKARAAESGMPGVVFDTWPLTDDRQAELILEGRKMDPKKQPPADLVIVPTSRLPFPGGNDGERMLGRCTGYL